MGREYSVLGFPLQQPQQLKKAMMVKEIATITNHKTATATGGTPEKARDYTPTNL